MLEGSHYENADLWNRDRYLADERELRRFVATAEMVPEHAATLLDVGTGNGAFLAYLETRRPALRLTGLERSPSAIQHLVCQAPVSSGSIESIPFPDQSFDVCSALEVLEHLPFGVFEVACAELARVARTHVLVSVPANENRVNVTCSYCGCEFNYNYHVRSFPDSSFSDLVPGFELDRLVHVSTRDVLMGKTWRKLMVRNRRKVMHTGLCPQCGYKAPSKPNAVVMSHRVKGASTLSRVLRPLLPVIERPVWSIGLYRRKAHGVSALKAQVGDDRG